MDLWDIDEGIDDPARFFRLVGQCLPQTTHLFIEGSSVAPDVEACYARHADPGAYLPKRQTRWPRAKLFRCSAKAALLEELAQLASVHAVPELLDHLSLYEGDAMLLEWHDAFANAVLLNGSLPETTVSAMANAFGLPYGRARFG